MYLLIPIPDECRQSGIDSFTFHNVSINSGYEADFIVFLDKFTFHNVSINSSFAQRQALNLVDIYIP